MCNFEWIETTRHELENAMLVPGEYKIMENRYYIPNILGFLDGYICPCSLNEECN